MDGLPPIVRIQIDYVHTIIRIDALEAFGRVSVSKPLIPKKKKGQEYASVEYGFLGGS